MFFGASCFAGFLTCLVLRHPELAAEESIYVNQPVVNMQVAPDAMSEVDSQAIYGTPVVILEKAGEWVKIQTPDQYSGWTKECYLIKRSDPYLSTPTIAQVKTLFAHIFWVNDTSTHPPMMTLPFESKLEVLTEADGLNDRWICVRLIDGKKAWIQKGDVHFNPELLTMDEVIALSKQFIGLPYTWGGTSSYGFDCSGFVQMLYRQMGIPLPRNSRPQSTMEESIPVNDNQLLPGDLVFFGPRGKAVNHVGFYLGDGYFIHSKAQITRGSPGVQISRLDDPYWPEDYFFARRVSQLAPKQIEANYGVTP